MLHSHYSHGILLPASAFHLKALSTKHKHEFLFSFSLSLSLSHTHTHTHTHTDKYLHMWSQTWKGTRRAQVAFDRRDAQCHRNVHMHPHKGNHVRLVIHEIDGLLYSPAGSMWSPLESPFHLWTEPEQHWSLLRDEDPQWSRVRAFSNWPQVCPIAEERGKVSGDQIDAKTKKTL